MRTTLTLDPDIHHAVRSIARERGESLGKVVSSLARAALTWPNHVHHGLAHHEWPIELAGPDERDAVAVIRFKVRFGD